MKKSTKIALSSGLLIMTALIASSCTSNFCKNIEKSRILFAVDPGVSVYYSSKEECEAAQEKDQSKGMIYTYEQVFADNDHLWRSIEQNSDETFTKSDTLSSVIKSAKTKYYTTPSLEYFMTLDHKILLMSMQKENLSSSEITVDTAVQALTKHGYQKFYDSTDGDLIWGNYDYLNGVISKEIGAEKCPSYDFVTLYKQTMNSSVTNTKSCIAVVDGDYGAFGQYKTSVTIDAKDWGYAWSKGPISGLIVYPVAWLTDTLTAAFAGGRSNNLLQAGWPQLLALVVVTIIVRAIIFLATFKSTLSQQKMQALQPELAKIQAKYPNSNTNQAEKQRLAEEQMRLYKKHKINPLSQILILIIQFPIFIGVWGAMTGSAVLSTGKFLNLNLSTSIWDALKNTSGLPGNVNGWWTALILFLLMSVAQFLSMKVPQWISKARAKKVARLGVNPAQKSQNRTMNIVSYVMLIMIIFMGFTLPAAMGVYWLIGAVFSLAQSLITQTIIGRKKK